jgi:hypothetical protein
LRQRHRLLLGRRHIFGPPKRDAGQRTSAFQTASPRN